MKALRRAVFWCHLAAGVTAGSIVFVLAATGVLLALQPQILRRLDRHLRTVVPPPQASRQGAAALLAAAREAAPGARATALTVSSRPEETAAVSIGRDRTLYLDPYSGRVLGEGSRAARRFFSGVTDWHRWLAASEKNRDAGRAVTGACNAAFLLLALTGPYLWWPRQWSLRGVRGVTLFQRGLTGRARDLNWHNVIGFWSAPVLLLITATGLVMSYRWANDLVYRAAGSEPPAPRVQTAPSGRGPREGGRGGPAELDRNLDRLWERAALAAPGWRSITLRLPEADRSPVSFSIDEGGTRNPFGRSQLTLDPKTGTVLKWEPYSGASRGRKIRSWMRGIHTGEAGGLPGQLVAGLASLGATVLVWTGISLALRRLRAARAARSETPARLAQARARETVAEG